MRRLALLLPFLLPASALACANDSESEPAEARFRSAYHMPRASSFRLQPVALAASVAGVLLFSGSLILHIRRNRK